MGTLKDQLLKAGLAPKKPQQQAKKKKQPTQPKKKRVAVGEATLRAQRAMLKKAKRDKKLNEERAKEAAKKAKVAEVKQLIDKYKLDRKDADLAFHFTYAKKVRKLFVTPAQQNQLSKNELGIVTLGNDVFDLVPIDVANKILQREQNFVVRIKAESQLDDEYANYEIPDDLTW